MQIPLNNIHEMRNCERRIDENRLMQIEDYGQWLVGYRNEIFRVFVSINGHNFLKFTIHNLNNVYTLTDLVFHDETITENHPKFYPIMKMYGPEILKTLNN
jgi:hypothetical protein